MNLLFLERKALGLFSADLFQLADAPPHRRRTHLRNISGGHQQMRLIGFQWFGRLTGFRPPYESTFGEPFLRQPAALSIIGKEPDRRSAAAPEHKNASGKWIFGQLVLTQPDQRIDSFSSVHGLNGNQHTHLRRDLDHRAPSRHARNKFVQSGGTLDLH